MPQQPEPAGGERLHKVMAAAGVASRRRCEVLITEGRVTVNGRRVTELGTLVRPGTDLIAVDGKPVEVTSDLEYWALYKPAGVLSAAADARGRTTVVDLVKQTRQRIVPIGRLDLDAEGLLVLTNDGELVNRLLHPRYAIEKEYRVLVRGVPDAAALEAITKGAMVEGKWAAPKFVSVEGPDKSPRLRTPQTWLRLTLTDGRKREIKVICGAAGHPVARLIRVRFGPLVLGRMHSGEIRPLTEGEVNALKRAANQT